MGIIGCSYVRRAGVCGMPNRNRQRGFISYSCSSSAGLGISIPERGAALDFATPRRAFRATSRYQTCMCGDVLPRTMAALEFCGLMGTITLGAFTSETGVVMALEQCRSLRSHEGLSNRHTTRSEPGETSAPWPAAAGSCLRRSRTNFRSWIPSQIQEPTRFRERASGPNREELTGGEVDIVPDRGGSRVPPRSTHSVSDEPPNNSRQLSRLAVPVCEGREGVVGLMA